MKARRRIAGVYGLSCETTGGFAVKMSSKTGASAGSTTGDDKSGERLHIRAIKEMPSHQDDEIAVIFREMRHASELSLEQLSAKLNAPVATLQALETGAIAALPDWIETSRIVSSYAGLMGLDSRPVLRRIKAQMQAGGDKIVPPGEPAAAPRTPASAPAAAGAGQPAPASGVPRASQRVAPPAGPPMPPGAKPGPQAPAPPAAAAPHAAAAPEQSPPSAPAASPLRGKAKPVKRARSIWGTLATWLIVLTLFVAMGAGVRYAAQNPSRVWSVVNALPDPAPQVIRSAWELVRPLENNAPASPGKDPKGQKSDKVSGDQPARAN